VSNDQDIVVGGLYATRPEGGAYRVAKVLVAGEEHVELRCYAARFRDLPVGVASAALGGTEADIRGQPYALLTRAGFWEHDPLLVALEPVSEDERAALPTWPQITAGD
jgi:hypothetical protein